MYRQGYGNTGPAGGPGPSNPYGNPYGNAGFQNQPYQQPSNAYANDDSGKKGSGNDPLLTVIRWFKARSDKERSAVVGVSALLALVVFYFIIEDHDTLFVMSEVIHFIGIALLGYKLLKQRNSAGLSLGSQELTLIFLAMRMFCSFVMEYDVHTLLDLMSLGATGAVVYGMRGPLRATYQKEFDTMHTLVVMAPCLLLAVFIHPSTRHSFILRILWAFCVYLEAVSVLPQLRMMQKSGHVEKFTAHYVFALGLSRFVAASHWILQLLEGNSNLYLRTLTHPWPAMVLISEIVQTGILADFCWIYVKSYRSGSGSIVLPSVGIV
jgi:ER lumen protein retaining receptor